MPRNCANSYGNGNVVPVRRLHKVRQLMLKRPFKSLIARIAIVALALSLVVPFVPAAFAQDASIDYAENGTGPVQTFVLSDQDASEAGWSVSGPDSGDFKISDDGALSFKSSPNYESPADTGGDNTYNVTVNRSGGSLDVAVTVTNVDEAGSVSLDDLQPQAGASVSATLSDPDGDASETAWQWSKSMDQASWTDIAGATSATYAPGRDDEGYYLQATATYSDGLGTGRDSASAVTVFAVERRPAANSQPSFGVQDEDPQTAGLQVNRTVKETAKTGSSVGNAVTATDADNDPLLYSLTDGDENANDDGVQYVDSDDNEDTPERSDGHSQWFQINARSGQVSVSSSKSQSDVRTEFDQEAADPNTSYTVTVTATDPSGSNSTVQVMIAVGAVDEAPVISLAADPGVTQGTTISIEGDEFVVTTPEEVTLDLSGTGDTDPLATGLPIFNANDPEEDAAVDKVSWSISGGADAKRFDIEELADATAPANSAAALRWATDNRKGPSFEDMDSADGDNVYLVTVTASDGVASNSQAVSVTVQNTEEDGSVGLSQLQPQQGIAITARLSDNDGNITGTEWQWYRGGADAANTADPRTDDEDIEGEVTVAGAVDCADDTAATTVCKIDGATSSTYIPKAADDGRLLTAEARYNDAFGTTQNSARKTSANAAELRPNENDLPSFGDEESVDRSVAENAKGASVGDPVTAIDDDVLQYALSGDGSDNFKVDNSGQITTKNALDYETQSSYAITVTATDPSLASGSIMVNITVTDADDPATISAATSIEYAENGTDAVETFTLSDQDASEAGWSVSGPDSGDFEISDDGALSFKSSPNYESPADTGGDNTYNVTVNRSGGSLDVAVTVTNVDEMGSVSLDDLQPQAGESVSATLSDPDGDASETAWQWSKSMDQAAWEDIAGATSATYAPSNDDAGYYLRATATYSDGLGTGRDSASAVTSFAVERRPAANNQPSFGVQDEDPQTAGNQVTRTVKETAATGSSVGNAVTATDSDNDPLLYSLEDGDTDLTTDGIQHENDDQVADTPERSDGDSQWFQINANTGQISVSSSKSQSDVRTEFDQEAEAADLNTSYTVTVTATDPSGSNSTVQVMIAVGAVDEAPVISLAADPGVTQGTTISIEGDEFVVTTPEEVTLDLSGTGDTDALATGLPIFNADDPEEDAEVDKVTWSISGGADAKRFDIEELAEAETDFNSSAALRWATDNRKGPSFEDMDSADGDNVYLVTVTASDGVASKSQLVNITVQNVEENGSVGLSQPQPQQGIAITARLSDNDGNITGTEWQWYRGGADAANTADPRTDDEDIEGEVTVAGAVDCADDTAATTVCKIDGATSSTYIPKAADDGRLLTAEARYNDAFGTTQNSARKTSANAAELRPNENDLPSFGDEESVDRSVAENAKGASVGDPVTAIDDDVLQYALSGDGSDNFKVDNSGQITTKNALDYETQSSYAITVTATDPSLASGSIVVNITVTDTDDAATIVPATENTPPTFAAESVTVSVDENAEAGTPVGDPITAKDKDGQDITYALDDSSVVEIWPSGQLTVAEGANLDYEGDANSYTVILTASDGIGGSSIEVTVNVNNVGLDNGYDTDDNGEISRDEAIAAVDDYFLDNITRDEVNAILALYFG